MSVYELQLAGHVAVVTGANHGIGAAIARNLATCGAGVVLTYLRMLDNSAAEVPEHYRGARTAARSRTQDRCEERCL